MATTARIRKHDVTAVAVQIQLPDNFSEVVAVKIAEACQRVSEGRSRFRIKSASRLSR